MLKLEKNGNGTLLNMVHANLPDEHAESIKSGWTDCYWTPWKTYLAEQKASPKNSTGQTSKKKSM